LIFPKPEYIDDSKLWLSFVPTYLAFGFMPLVSILTVMFVLEKERKIKEGMLMMGLRLSAYWFSWIMIEGILVFFLSVIITTITYFSKIIDNINPLIIFLLVFLFGISMIGISALISPFFKKEKVTSLSTSRLLYD
jgi:ATP-binding cassette subfamily A (ABC1) protein 5